MVRVKLSGPLRTAAGGKAEVEVDAANIHQLLDSLGRDFPKLKPQIERGVAVAVDGQIYRDDWFQPIAADSEVVVLPRMAGG